MRGFERALEHVRAMAVEPGPTNHAPITLNFHPDLVANGALVIGTIANDGTIRSQFETRTSSGSVTAFPGGERWEWESRIFGGAYDDLDPSHRPKYASVNHTSDPYGGAPRFGSAYFRLKPHIRARTTYCYPDSHLHPKSFAVEDPGSLVTFAKANPDALDAWLDNYIEAHIHGPLLVADDVEALVLDPSFKGTEVEDHAARLDCPVEWHQGFCLGAELFSACETYRGASVADAIARLCDGKPIRPSDLSRARANLLDYQMAKWVWHCLARFGRAVP